MVRSGRRENYGLQEAVRLGRCSEESLGVRRRSGSDPEAAGRPVAASCCFPPAAIAGEDEEADEREKEEKRFEMHRKEAKKQETNMAKLREESVT